MSDGRCGDLGRRRVDDGVAGGGALDGGSEKFTIASAFAIAGSALAHGRSGGSGGLTALLAGCAVLRVAALTPWVLLRMLPGSQTAAGGLHRGAVKGAAGTATGATTATMVPRQAMLRSFGGAIATPRASTAAPRSTAPPPPRKPPAPPTTGAGGGGPTLDRPSRRDRESVGERGGRRPLHAGVSGATSRRPARGSA